MFTRKKSYIPFLMIFLELIFIGILSLNPFPQRDILKMSDFKDNRFKMQVKIAK